MKKRVLYFDLLKAIAIIFVILIHVISEYWDNLDVNSNKLGNTVNDRNEKLVKMLNKIGDLNLSDHDNTIDAFGDAYEYLMTMYASNAGKSGGEFFTPQEVGELLARIVIIKFAL